MAKVTYRQGKTRFRNRGSEAKGIPALAAYCDIRGEDKYAKPKRIKRKRVKRTK